jgi:LysM repeat protein/lysozyme family protein
MSGALFDKKGDSQVSTVDEPASSAGQKVAAEESRSSRGFLSDLIMPIGAAVMLAVALSEKASAASPVKAPSQPPTAENARRTLQGNSPRFTVYRIEKGDTLSAIAKRFNVTQDFLLATNPDLEPNALSIGQGVRLPLRPDFHIVKKGESPSSIAEKHGLTVKDVLDANPGINPKSIQIGQHLSLPAPTKIRLPSAEPSKEGGTPPAAKQVGPPVGTPPSVHLVRAGENPSKIAHAHGIKLEQLMAANPGLNPRNLKVGQELHLPVAQAPTPPVLAKAIPSQTNSFSSFTQTAPAHREARSNAPAVTTTLSVKDAPSFFTFIKQTLGFEGMKIQRDKDDPGNHGPADLTNCGITGIAMKQHIKDTQKRDASDQEVQSALEKLTLQEAVEVYATGFWKPAYARLPEKVAFMTFDWGVNSSPPKVIARYQKHLGLHPTGQLDEQTLATISSLGDDLACQKFAECRKRFYEKRAESEPGVAKYLPGWTARVDQSLRFVNSHEFKELKGVFEKTAHRGCDFFDPVREGLITLKRGTTEAALTRHLQERLIEAGYGLGVDGVWGTEMDRVVGFFKQKHGLPGKPEWSVRETTVLDAVLRKDELRTAVAGNFSGLVLPPR